MTGPTSDAERIRRLLHDYAAAIDGKDWELFARLFHPDCAMDTGAGTIRGAAELTRHMRDLHAPLEASLHRITNIVVDGLDGAGSTSAEATSVEARSQLDAVLVRPDHPAGPTLRVLGTYRDDLVRSGDRWVIAHRVFQPVWREGRMALLRPPAS